MPKEITWSLHSETGNWNTSFNTARIGDYLNFLNSNVLGGTLGKKKSSYRNGI